MANIQKSASNLAAQSLSPIQSAMFADKGPILAIHLLLKGDFVPPRFLAQATRDG